MLINKLSRPRYVFLIIMALSAVIYVGACLAIGPRTDVSLLDADEREYYTLAGDLLHGRYEFNARRTLGHILVLTIARLVTFDHFIATQLVITLVFSLVGPLMYILVKRMTNNTILAIIVALLVVVWPPFVYYSRTLYSEAVALPVFIGFLILLPRGSLVTTTSEGWRRGVLAGLCLGVCMLIRPMYLLFSPMAIAILFLEERRVRAALWRSLQLGMGCALVILPWAVYMSIHAGTPILVSANGGETISGGLNQVLVQQGYRELVTPDGRKTWSGPGKWITVEQNGYLTADEQKLPYVQKDKLLRQRTIAWVTHNPGSALYLQAAKLLYMWGFYPFWNGAKQTLIGNVPTIAVLLLSIVSLFRFRYDMRRLSRFWLLPVFVSLVALVSWGSWRFRQPGDLGLLMLTGLLLWSWLAKPAQTAPALRERTSQSLS